MGQLSSFWQTCRHLWLEHRFSTEIGRGFNLLTWEMKKKHVPASIGGWLAMTILEKEIHFPSIYVQGRKRNFLREETLRWIHPLFCEFHGLWGSKVSPCQVTFHPFSRPKKPQEKEKLTKEISDLEVFWKGEKNACQRLGDLQGPQRFSEWNLESYNLGFSKGKGWSAKTTRVVAKHWRKVVVSKIWYG